MPATEPGLVSIVRKVDGRRLRSERTRLAIIEGFMELLRRTPAMPKVSQIAAEAGCSTRSVFERFTDLDGLALAATDYATVQAQVEAVPRNLGADRTTRIHSHVETRAFVCEKWLPLWRLIARQAQPELRQRAAMVRSLVLERLKLMYGPELSRIAEQERDRTLMALATLISFESWDQLRHSYSLSMEAAQAVWRSAIDRLLPRDDLLLGTSG
jgi:AcrR family transcriptional regulator